MLSVLNSTKEIRCQRRKRSIFFCLRYLDASWPSSSWAEGVHGSFQECCVIHTCNFTMFLLEINEQLVIFQGEWTEYASTETWIPDHRACLAATRHWIATFWKECIELTSIKCYPSPEPAFQGLLISTWYGYAMGGWPLLNKSTLHSDLQLLSC